MTPATETQPTTIRRINAIVYVASTDARDVIRCTTWAETHDWDVAEIVHEKQPVPADPLARPVLCAAVEALQKGPVDVVLTVEPIGGGSDGVAELHARAEQNGGFIHVVGSGEQS